MNRQDLLDFLKQEAASFSVEEIAHRIAKGNRDDNVNLVAKYNLDTLLEIRNTEVIDDKEVVDSKLLSELTDTIDNYMDKYAPGQEDFKRYVRIISVYLVIIAQKPLHPPGMTFSGGKKVVGKNKKFYCPNKNRYLGSSLNLCKFCVCCEFTF